MYQIHVEYENGKTATFGAYPSKYEANKALFAHLRAIRLARAPKAIHAKYELIEGVEG